MLFASEGKSKNNNNTWLSKFSKLILLYFVVDFHLTLAYMKTDHYQKYKWANKNTLIYTWTKSVILRLQTQNTAFSTTSYKNDRKQHIQSNDL